MKETSAYDALATADWISKVRLRAAILRYITRNPDVADTAKGIVGWWLPPEGYEDAPDHIAVVLEEMAGSGWLETIRMGDGKILYRRRRAVC